MRKVKKWRYYCDFCKKVNGSSFHMKRHEANCTANPHRGCGLCERLGGNPEPMTKLIKALGVGDKDGMEALRDITENCPACILAAIRQSGVMELSWDDDNVKRIEHQAGSWTDFKYKDEHKSFWADMEPDRY